MKKLVIYHAFCTDGTAAAVAHRIGYERKHPGKDALDEYTYVPMGHGVLDKENEFKETIKGFWNVTFLDFAPTASLLTMMLDNNIEVTIVDHHKTFIDMVKEFKHPNMDKLYVVASADNKLSGATLTWLIGIVGVTPDRSGVLREVEIHEHKFLLNGSFGFIKEETILHKDPLYNLIGIRDTWDESNPKMKAKADALHSYFDFYNVRGFDDFYKFVKDETFVFNSASIIEAGSMVLEFNKRICKDALKNAYTKTIETSQGPIKLAIGIAPDGQGSQYGQTWADMNPREKTISVAVFVNFLKQTVTLGMRSRNIDALPLASSFHNGGGHPMACGCSLTNVSIPYEHSTPGVTDFIDWIIHEIGERIETIYNVEVEA